MPSLNQVELTNIVEELNTLADEKNPITLFLNKWGSIKAGLQLEDLTAIVEEGSCKGQSLLWVLALSAQRHSAPWNAVWAQYHDAIELKVLTQIAEEGPSKGKSALRHLAAAIHHGNPEPWNAVWAKHQDAIELKALTQIAEDGPHEGISALQLLAQGITFGYPEAWNAVWAKHQHAIELKDLVKMDRDEGLCPLFYILFTTPNGDRFTGVISSRIVNINQRLLAQVRQMMSCIPGEITISQLMSSFMSLRNLNILTLLQKADPSFIPLIEAKNELFAALKSENEVVSELEIKRLFNLAQAAQDKGYQHPFYDLGMYLKGKWQDLEGATKVFQCFSRVPPEARKYPEAQARMRDISADIAEGYFALFNQTVLKDEAWKTSFIAHDRLKAGLEWAFRCDKPNTIAIMQQFYWTLTSTMDDIDLSNLDSLEKALDFFNSLMSKPAKVYSPLRDANENRHSDDEDDANKNRHSDDANPSAHKKQKMA